MWHGTHCIGGINVNYFFFMCVNICARRIGVNGGISELDLRP